MIVKCKNCPKQWEVKKGQKTMTVTFKDEIGNTIIDDLEIDYGCIPHCSCIGENIFSIKENNTKKERTR